MHWITGDFHVIQEDVALIRLQHSGDHVKGGCLACSIWTKQSYNLTP
jgi:hypothetical protein